MFCDQCGKQLKDNDNFCTGCGHKVTKPDNTQTVNSAQHSADEIKITHQTQIPSANKPKSNKALIATICVFAALLAILTAVLAFVVTNKDTVPQKDKSEYSYSETKKEKPYSKKPPKQSDENEEKTELIIGYTIYEPYNYYEDGELTGFDTELAGYVCNKLGLTPVFKEISWDEKQILLESGDIDCVWNGMSYTDETSSTMSLSDIYTDEFYYDSDNDTTIGASIVIGFKKGSELTQKVNKIIAEAKEDGTLDSLKQKYLFYRVRLSEDDSASQIGAFIDFEMAKNLADNKASEGYEVYNFSNELVYQP